MPDPKPKPKPKPKGAGGSPLTKKVGPVPVWVIGAGLLGLVAYLYLKHRSAGYATSGAGLATVVGSTQGSAQQAASSGAPASNGAPASQLSPETLAALGDYQSSLGQTIQDAFDQGNAQTAGIVAGLGGVQSGPSNGASSSISDVKVAAPPKTAVAAPKASSSQTQAAPRYYTFKPGTPLSQVKAKGYSAGDIAPSGGTLKFAQGKGYYIG